MQIWPRIIPARAGPTSLVSQIGMTNADHPRACGANVKSLFTIPGVAGSSPRVRGQRPHRPCLGPNRRIIPARAGPTCSPRTTTRGSADHPRACGANPLSAASCTPSDGSSPRVRGQHRRHVAADLTTRIIPARAGPTPTRRRSRGRSPDHPRACGANVPACSRWPIRCGSSPRVRGQRPARQQPGQPLRIIPARAGPTDSLRNL